MDILLVQPFIFPEAEILSKKKALFYTIVHKHFKNIAFLDNYLHLQQVAAVTPQKHSIKFIDERFNQIDFDINCNLVGITCVTGYATHAYNIADGFRKRGKKVVLGGPHPSALPNEAIQHADSVVIGEAEESWPQLLKDFEQGKMKTFYKQEKPVDPRLIPPPRRDIIKPHFFPVARIQATRGCPEYCDFCAIRNTEGSSLRKRSIENIINEIKSIPQKFLKFSDASLTTDPEYTKQLFSEMKGLKKKFTCFGNQDVLYRDEELLKISKDAGCIGWYIGFESINQKTIDKLGKPNKVENYIDTVKKIHSYRMAVAGSFIFGFEEDTIETFQKTLQMMNKMEIDLIEINELTPFPGTPLYKRLEKEERIINKNWFNYREGQPGTVPVFKPKNMSAEELRNNTNIIFRKWYMARNSAKRMAKSIRYGFYPFLFTALGPVLFA